MTLRASSGGADRIRCNCFITTGETHCWVHICLINYTNSPSTTLLFIKTDVWHILLSSVRLSSGRRIWRGQMLRGGLELLLQRVKQRCTLTEEALFESLHSSIWDKRANRPHFLPHSLAWRRIHGPVPAKIGHCRRACGSSLDNEAQRWGPLGFSRPNYTQRGLFTLVVTVDLFPVPCLKGLALIVFTEGCQTGRIKAC